MIGIGSPYAFFIAVAVVALATPALVGSMVEAPPTDPVLRRVTSFATAWALAFLCASIAIVIYAGSVAVAGLLFADAQLAAGAAIWSGRAGVRDDGGGFGGDGDDPDDPSGGSLPDEYWRRWEEELALSEHELALIGREE